MTQGTRVGERVEQVWPAPGFRENQREVVERAVEIFEEDKADVVQLSAPTGFGKSVTLYGIVKALGAEAFYATPLKALQDQLTDDAMIGDNVVEIKGRSNYQCIYPGEDTTVDRGPCVREGLDCEYQAECPYYKQKAMALGSDIVVANMSYLMAESMVPDEAEGTFGSRDVLIVDECQSLEDWAINFVGTTISQYSVPEQVWENITLPPSGIVDDDGVLAEFAAEVGELSVGEAEKAIRYDKIDPVNASAKWLREEVLPEAVAMQEYLSGVGSLTEEQTEEMESLQRFEVKVRRLLDDVEDNEWVVQFDERVRKNGRNYTAVEFKPIRVGRFLDDLLWQRADKIILSSATIPGGDWAEEIGLGDRRVASFNVPSTFPTENRPIVTDEAVGKMTYKEREENIGAMAAKIMELSERHSGQKGFVHCRGYNYIQMLKRAVSGMGESSWWYDTVMTQDRDRREESLQEWLESDKQIFLSVAMDEGIDLAGDDCRWQVLLKTLYPHMGDERVSYRVQELNDWDWYNRQAAIQIQQAYGRGVRSDEDWCTFYVLDESGVGLIERNERLFEDWFLSAVGGSPVGVGE